MNSPDPTTPVPLHPFEGLYAFVRSHLTIVNNVLLACGTLVGALDFLAPKLSLLPILLYSFTTLLAGCMVVLALAPALVARLWALTGQQWTHQASPMWHRPAWQLGVAFLVGVSAIGFASVAKADQGGLLANAFPTVRSLQENLLAMRADVSDIKSGVGQANEKLDRIAGVVDPALAADRCADLECAVTSGASLQAIRRLFDKGVQVPRGQYFQGYVLFQAALKPGSDRLEVIDFLAQKGLKLDVLIPVVLTDPATLTKQGQRVTAEIIQTANLAANPHLSLSVVGASAAEKDMSEFNAVANCFQEKSGGVTLLEFAAILGDAELTAYLNSRGVKQPSRPLVCGWHFLRGEGFARVEIDAATGKYVGVSAH